MAHRRLSFLRALACLLVPALVLAQSYPYWPPPGTTWTTSTKTWGSNLSLAGNSTINQITIPANISPATATSGTDGLFNSAGDLTLGFNWGGGTAGSVQCNFTSTFETMLCFQGAITYLESSDAGMGFTLVEDSANTSANDVSIHLMDQNGSQGGFGYTPSGSAHCPGENASVPTPPTTSMCMYIIGGGAGGAGIGPVMLVTQGTNENVNNLYADQTQLFLAVSHNFATTAVAEKMLTAVDNGSGVVTTTLGDSSSGSSVTNIKGGSAANTQVNGAPIASVQTGTFSATVNAGCGTTPSATLNWTLQGKLVTLSNLSGSALTCTSNANNLAINGLPAAIIPTTAKDVTTTDIEDNTVSPLTGCATIGTGGGVTLAVSKTNIATNFVECSTTGFTTTGTKGLTAGWSIVYSID